ncbi:flagellar motor protein MotB, partial [Streptomyces griseoflavus]
VAVTPPNETTALTLKWPWGPLIHQDGATHPATFVNPIG